MKLNKNKHKPERWFFTEPITGYSYTRFDLVLSIIIAITIALITLTILYL